MGLNMANDPDPRTEVITEYQAAYLAGKDGHLEGGSKHTVRIDPNGYVWATGDPLTRFAPKTGKFTEFPEVPSVYGIAIERFFQPSNSPAPRGVGRFVGGA